jgi:hypothetical protein
VALVILPLPTSFIRLPSFSSHPLNRAPTTSHTRTLLLILLLTPSLPLDLQTHTHTRLLVCLFFFQRTKLFEHFVSIGFSIETVTTQWFLSLFLNLTPTETCLRILDSFFADGTTAFFAASIGIVVSCEEDLLQVSDFDEAFVCLQQAAARAYDPDAILKVGFAELGSFSFEKLLRLRTEAYQGMLSW